MSVSPGDGILPGGQETKLPSRHSRAGGNPEDPNQCLNLAPLGFLGLDGTFSRGSCKSDKILDNDLRLKVGTS
jgi:hypothetical protein